MLIDIGEKVHLIERRLFESDVRRHFVGVVERADAAAMRVRGYVFTHDSASSQYMRSEDQRIRIFPLTTSGFIVNVIDPSTEIDNVRYVLNEIGRLVVTDGGAFSLDINEFGRMR
jgi:hypothetical protein